MHEARTTGKRAAISMFALLMCAEPLHASKAIHVSVGGSNVPPYATWPTAATNLCDAVDFAVDGDVVLISNGWYTLGKEVVLSNAVVVRSDSGSAVGTIIDGGFPYVTNRCFTLNHPLALLQGLTITNGAALIPFESDRHFGGGVWCREGTVRQSRIVGCRAFSGGGAWCSGGVIEDSAIAGNTALDGGGLVVLGSGVAVRCTIVGNTATAGAGGGVVLGNGGELRESVSSSNSAVLGGGVLVDGDSVARNCLFVQNTATEHGGGAVLSDGGRIENCTVISNAAAISGGGVYNSQTGAVINSVVYFNESGRGANWDYESIYTNFVASCSLPLPPGVSNIETAPRFVNWSSGDFRLLSNSPCIDAGVALAVAANDLDGLPRPLDGDADGTGEWDIGAHEYLNPVADTDHDGLLDSNEVFGTGTNPLVVDTDGDEMGDGAETMADTDPLSSTSVLTFTDIRRAANGVRLNWRGGVLATQFLEVAEALALTNAGWQPILGIPPPTPVSNAVIDLRATNATLFYRIRAGR